MDPALIDRGNLIDGDWANYSWNDSQHYHARGNDYSFDALQTNCFGINIKL